MRSAERVRGGEIHRLMLPGSPAEALSAYADRVRSDVVVIPAEYKVGWWVLKLPFAPAVAALTS